MVAKMVARIVANKLVVEVVHRNARAVAMGDAQKLAVENARKIVMSDVA